MDLAHFLRPYFLAASTVNVNLSDRPLTGGGVRYRGRVAIFGASSSARKAGLSMAIVAVSDVALPPKEKDLTKYTAGSWKNQLFCSSRRSVYLLAGRNLSHRHVTSRTMFVVHAYKPRNTCHCSRAAGFGACGMAQYHNSMHQFALLRCLRTFQ